MWTLFNLEVNQSFRRRIFPLWYGKCLPITLLIRLTFLFGGGKEMNYALFCMVAIFDIFFVHTLLVSEDRLVPFGAIVKISSILFAWLYQLACPTLPTHSISIIHLFKISILTTKHSRMQSIFLMILIINVTLAHYFLSSEGGFTASLRVFSMHLFVFIALSGVLNVLQQYFDEQLEDKRKITTQTTTCQVLTETSHELRNPLQALEFLVSDLASSQEDTEGKQKAHMKSLTVDIQNTLDLINSIIESILDFSKIGANKVLILSIKFNVMELIDRISTIFWSKAISKHLMIMVDVDPSIPVNLYGDPTKLLQILSNFITNAIKFTSRGKIIVGAHLVQKTQSQCVIRYFCRDTGIGMTKAEIDKMFLPYEQFATTICGEKGWGLGLPIVYKLVKLMNSQIHVESEVGIGTTFSCDITHQINGDGVTEICEEFKDTPPHSYLVLFEDNDLFEIARKYLHCMNALEVGKSLQDLKFRPVVVIRNDTKECPVTGEDLVSDIKFCYTDPEYNYYTVPMTMRQLRDMIIDSPSPKHRPGPCVHGDLDTRFSNLNVLLVEDNPMVHKLERELIKKMGFKQIYDSFDGKDALQVFKNSKCDLVLADCQLPGMDGISLIRIIRHMSDFEKSRVPVVLISGDGVPSMEDSKKTIMMTKPVKYEELYKAITNLKTPSWKKIYSCPSVLERLDTIHRIEYHQGCVNAIQFNQKGTLLITGSDDKTLKVTNTYSQKLLTTLHGHTSNVFACQFLDNTDKTVVSGSNDSDIRCYDLEAGYNTIYSHHLRKVLCIAVNQNAPDTFLSCSADGTIRLFDIRRKYQNCRTEKTPMTSFDENVMPQAMGGGRVGRSSTVNKESLLIDYNSKNPGACLYSVDISPNGNHFIVAGSDGNVRMFDLRKIDKYGDPNSCLNVFRDISVRYSDHECTGCSFSKDGKEIVSTLLDGEIHLFDTDVNFSQKFEIDYFSRKPFKGVSGNKIVEKLPLEKCAGLNSKQIYDSSIISYISNTFYHDVDNDEPPELIPESKTENDSLISVKTYKQKFSGHFSQTTIKGVWFFGPKSEYIISGSDEGHIFIWDKKTAKVVRILEDHENNVNTVTAHPFEPILASSGIDSFVNIWTVCGEYPKEDEEVTREKRIAQIVRSNTSKPHIDEIQTRSSGNPRNLMDLFQMFQSMVREVGHEGPTNPYDEEDDEEDDDDEDETSE